MQAACPALLELQAQRLLLVDCSGRAEALVAVAQVALAVRAVLEVVALEVVAAVLAAVHTPLALVA